MRKLLVTGATGQIGAALVPALRRAYGTDRVVAAGHRRRPAGSMAASGTYVELEVTDAGAVLSAVESHGADAVFHLASLLSAVAEQRPQSAWDINVNGLLNVLEAARRSGSSVFFPSSIGAFGPSTPLVNTPQDTIQRPNTMYGITKVAGELLCDYYHTRYAVDTRGVRYPGLISHEAQPGGGTTDYAVDMFHGALENGRYECYLGESTRLDMMYMPDAVRAAMQLMEADAGRLEHRNGYNVTAMSFTPAELAAEIRKHVPGFAVEYRIDPVRQKIAESWPRHMDDSVARREWGWRHHFDLPAMVADMMEKLGAA